jgi:mRNA interferase MazF
VFVRAPEGGLSVDSVVILNHIRTVDRRRLGKRLGTLRSDTMKQVDQAIMISLGLFDV